MFLQILQSQAIEGAEDRGSRSQPADTSQGRFISVDK